MANSTTTPMRLSGRRVLVVEDDYFIAQETRSMLEQNGAEVLGPAASVDDALAIIASTSTIDAAVLDINVRDVMVFPVADALRERGVPFLFATGYEKATIPDRFAGAQHCEKPIRFAAFMTVFLP